MATKKSAKKSIKAGRYALMTKSVQKKATQSVRISRTSDGKFVIDGVSQGRLVNKYPDVKVRKTTIKPLHFSETDISEIVKSMKVA